MRFKPKNTVKKNPKSLNKRVCDSFEDTLEKKGYTII